MFYIQARIKDTEIGDWLKEAQEIVLQVDEPETTSAILPRISITETGFKYIPNSAKRVRKEDKAIEGPRKSSFTYILKTPNLRMRKRDWIAAKKARGANNPKSSIPIIETTRNSIGPRYRRKKGKFSGLKKRKTKRNNETDEDGNTIRRSSQGKRRRSKYSL